MLLEDKLGKTNLSECHYVPKGWGSEYWLANNENYCCKLLILFKDKRLSWHKHNIKKEHFFVTKGVVKLKYGTNPDIAKAFEVILTENDIFFIPTGLLHQVIALEDSEIIEVSTTHFDTDSIRIIKGD